FRAAPAVRIVHRGRGGAEPARVERCSGHVESYSPKNGEGVTPKLGNVGDNLVGSLGLGRYGPGMPAVRPVAAHERLLGRLNRGLSSGLTVIELPGPDGFGRT